MPQIIVLYEIKKQFRLLHFISTRIKSILIYLGCSKTLSFYNLENLYWILIVNDNKNFFDSTYFSKYSFLKNPFNNL